MLIKDAIKKEMENRLPDKKAILELYAENPNQVFRWKETATLLKRDPESVRRHLHELSKYDKIGRYTPEGKKYSYYGSLEAVKKLKASLTSGD